MELALNPEMQRFVEEQVKAGHYARPEDVVRAALASLMQQGRLEEVSASEMEEAFPGLRQKIAQGLAEARAGRVSDGETFFDELEREDGVDRDGGATGLGRKTA